MTGKEPDNAYETIFKVSDCGDKPFDFEAYAVGNLLSIESQYPDGTQNGTFANITLSKVQSLQLAESILDCFKCHE